MPEAATLPELLAFTMPSLGADMDAGTVTEWLVKPGDEVHRGDIVAIVETDKSDLDVEVFTDGTVVDLVVPAGEKVPVGTVLARLAPTSALRAASAEGTQAPSAAPVAGKRAEVPEPVEPPAAVEVPTAVESAAVGIPAPDVSPAPARITSPLLRRLAEALDVDVTDVHGSGRGGRITRDDIEHAVGHRRITPRARRLARRHGIDASSLAIGRVVRGADVLAAVAAAPAHEAPAPERPSTTGRAHRSDSVGQRPDSTIEQRPTETGSRRRSAGTEQRSTESSEQRSSDSMRRAIARQMAKAWHEIPHYQVASRIDMHVCMEALAEVNARRDASNRLLPAAVLLHAAARAAAMVPGVNGFWRGDEFVPGDAVNLALVVALRSGGLLTPVLHDAANMTLDTVMSEMRDLVTRARSGRLRASEISGATFTVTQLGEGEVDAVMPIIHPPQVAILGLGSIHEEAWAEHGMLAARPVVHASLVGDHRAIDGRIGSLYLSRLNRCLQEAINP